ncbi:MFS general substrate transporter, partial [Sarocladium strictum]
KGALVLVPTPTTNPNDPLTWSKPYKAWNISCLLLWAFLANACIAWSSPAWAIWITDLDTTYVALDYGQSILVMMGGVGVLFLQPSTIKHSRRLSYFIGSLFILVGLICGILMTNISLYFAYMALAGIGTAPSYCTIITSLLDVTFLHQKGEALGLYGFVLSVGTFLPPLAAGYIVDAQGWLWVFRYLLVFFGVSTLLVVFTVEETSFARTAQLAREGGAFAVAKSLRSPILTGDGREPKDEAKSRATTFELHPTSSSTSVKASPAQPKRYTYLQRMTLYRPNEDVKAGYWNLTFSMVQVAALPASLWASLQLAFPTLIVSVIMTTQASFFAAPPYNFTPAQLGLMYIPVAIGALLGAVLSGPVTDMLLVRLARRRNGYHDPENRLWMYLPVPILVALGSLMYGVGAAAGVHWMIPCIGLFFIGMYINISLPVALGYALDSYPELEGEIVQLSTFTRQILGGAFSFCIQPWINHNGPQTTIIILTVIVVVAHVTSIAFQIWGKDARRKTAQRY